MTDKHVLEYCLASVRTPDAHSEFSKALDAEANAQISREPTRAFVEADVDTHNRLGRAAMRVGAHIKQTPF
jgi:hypothetical protein